MYASLEMSEEQVVLRALSTLSGVPGPILRSGRLDERARHAVEVASRTLKAAPL